MNRNGYDQFFKTAKKNSENSGQDTVTSIDIKKLNKKIKSNIQNKKENKKKFPLFSFIMFGICILGAFVLIEKYDNIEAYLSKIEIGLGTAQAEVAPATTPVLEKTEDAKKTNESSEPKMELTSSADEDYLFKLADRKKELDQREEELNKKSNEIAKQKTELEEKIKSLEEARAQITHMLKERIQTDSAKVDTLVQVYSNMKPIQAAKVFETLDEDLVIEILSRMKKKSAADILNLVKTDKAQVLSERYAGYRAPASIERALKNTKSDTEDNSKEENNEELNNSKP